ncbi:hypothetical protein M3Y95_00624700 [Aphelenchoides besseyi]|nr:hypothetical protein M3Y95_00624700 [Aphelenchoides besseyi]
MLTVLTVFLFSVLISTTSACDNRIYITDDDESHVKFQEIQLYSLHSDNETVCNGAVLMGGQLNITGQINITSPSKLNDVVNIRISAYRSKTWFADILAGAYCNDGDLMKLEFPTIPCHHEISCSSYPIMCKMLSSPGVITMPELNIVGIKTLVSIPSIANWICVLILDGPTHWWFKVAVADDDGNDFISFELSQTFGDRNSHIPLSCE